MDIQSNAHLVQHTEHRQLHITGTDEVKGTSERERVGKLRFLLCAPGDAKYSINIHTVIQLPSSHLLDTTVYWRQAKGNALVLPQFHTSLACAESGV